MDATTGSDPHQGPSKPKGVAAGRNPNQFVFGRSRCRRSAPRSWTQHHQVNTSLLHPSPHDDSPSAASGGFAAPKAASRAAADVLSAASFPRTHQSAPAPPSPTPFHGAATASRRGGIQPRVPTPCPLFPHQYPNPTPPRDPRGAAAPSRRGGIQPRVLTPCPLSPHQDPNPASPRDPRGAATPSRRGGIQQAK